MTFFSTRRLAGLGLLAALLASSASGASAAQPPIAETILFWSQAEQQHGYPRIREFFPTRQVDSGGQVLALPLGPAPRRATMADLEWATDDGLSNLRHYMESQRVAGLLVLQGGQVLFEDYRFEHGPARPWIAFSVAKSVSSLLIGAAIKDGYIGSVDEPVTAYLPRLRGSAYEGARIRDILTMSSGVAWNEDYASRSSDVAIAGAYNGLALQRYLADRPAAHPPGTVFNYNTGETNLVGEVLRAAIGNNAATYLSHSIWQPYGMANDAWWNLEGPGLGELGGCCLNATLADWARIGLFTLADGQLADGERVLPEGWMAAATSPSEANAGYGYLWWLFGDGSYAAQGIFGQMIYVDPALDLVIAQHGLWPKATGEALAANRFAMIQAVRAALR